MRIRVKDVLDMLAAAEFPHRPRAQPGHVPAAHDNPTSSTVASP
jgi:hypothetical protein